MWSTLQSFLTSQPSKACNQRIKTWSNCSICFLKVQQRISLDSLEAWKSFSQQRVWLTKSLSLRSHMYRSVLSTLKHLTSPTRSYQNCSTLTKKKLNCGQLRPSKTRLSMLKLIKWMKSLSLRAICWESSKSRSGVPSRPRSHNGRKDSREFKLSWKSHNNRRSSPSQFSESW